MSASQTNNITELSESVNPNWVPVPESSYQNNAVSSSSDHVMIGGDFPLQKARSERHSQVNGGNKYDWGRTTEPHIRIGDHICLYCTDVRGYAFSSITSSAENAVSLFTNQDQKHPDGISRAQVVSFRIEIENRYKLNKKLRQLNEAIGVLGESEGDQHRVHQAQKAALAETHDNEAEQKRLNGKRIKYGDTIQVKHLYTDKHLHVNPSKTSQTDKTCVQTYLLPYNGKEAQFKVLPKFKVNTEGEYIRVHDQVVIESVKYPGQYLCASKQLTHAQTNNTCELNLGSKQSAFTLVKRNNPRDTSLLWGGAIVQFHHKDLDAYLNAEGELGQLSEDVHFLVYEMSYMDSQLMLRPVYISTYWQVEHEESIIKGECFEWGQHIRIQHLQTSQYLCLKDDRVCLCAESKDPITVFKMHPMYEDSDPIPITDGVFVKLEHVVSGRWLHAERAQSYSRANKAVVPRKETLTKVTSTEELQYQDAFALHRMDFSQMQDVNYVIGVIPVLKSVISAIKVAGELSKSESQSTLIALDEIKRFIAGNQRRKNLVIEFKVIDLAVEIVKLQGLRQDSGSSQVCSLIYELLYTLVTGKGSDPALYVAQYMSFLQSQIHFKPTDSLSCTRVLTELCRDKKQVMDRMTPQQIDKCTSLLKKYKHPVYLQLLSTLCVCKGIAVPQNQKVICNSLVYRRTGYLYRFTIKEDGLVYTWKNSPRRAVLFSSLLNGEYGHDQISYVKEQLVLFEALCEGRNQYCIDAITGSGLAAGHVAYTSFDVAFAVLRDDNIPEEIQGLFCKLFICLSIKVGTNTPITDTISTAFCYETLDPNSTTDDWLDRQAQLGENTLWIKAPEVLDWVVNFLKENLMLKTNTGMRNKLILAQLKLLHTMIDFGYCDVARIKEILPILMVLMVRENRKFENIAYQKLMQPRKKLTRQLSQLFPGLMTRKSLSPFHSTSSKKKVTAESEGQVEIKYQAMVILQLLMDLQCHFRLERLVGIFKNIEINERMGDKDRHPLADFLYSLHGNKKTWFFNSPKGKLKSAVDNVVKDTTLLADEDISSVLLELAGYKDAEMTTKSLSLLHKYCNKSTILYNLAEHAQVLLTPQSLSIHHDVQRFLPVLRRLLNIKVHEEQVKEISGILENLTRCCYRVDFPNLPNECAQNVLTNHGLLPLLIQLLQTEEHDKKGTDDATYEVLMRDTLLLLYAMALENDGVQDYLFEHINILVNVKYAINDLAEVLKEIFRDNSSVCWQVEAQLIDKIFSLIQQHKDKAPNLIQVLQRIVVVKHGHIKRNQDLVMKIGSDKHAEYCYIFDLPKQTRERVLLGQTSAEMRSYLVHMLNLITLCSKDTKGPIQSFCQNLLSVEEVLSVINNIDIPNNIKRPYLRYFTVVCLRSPVPGQVNSTVHLSDLWTFIAKCEPLLGSIHTYINLCPTPKRLKITKIEDEHVPVTPDEMDQCNLFYFVDTVLPLLEAVFMLYRPDALYNNEVDTIQKLSIKLFQVAPSIASTLIEEKHFITLKIVVRKSAINRNIAAVELNDCINQLDFEPDKFEKRWHKRDAGTPSKLNQSLVSNHKSDRSVSIFETTTTPICSDHDIENQVNYKLQNFVKSCMALSFKENTVGSQLRVKGKVSNEVLKKEYTVVGSSEALPLCTDFQDHVHVFFSSSSFLEQTVEDAMPADKLSRITVLIRKLQIIALKTKAGIPTDSESLELRTLQILRAVLYNNIVLIPDRVEGKKRSKLSKMAEIVQLQDFLVSHGLIPIILDLLISKSGAVFREVLALLNCLLYDAHEKVQNEAITYFKRNRDEMFFKLVSDFLKRAALLAKERRALEHQFNRESIRGMMPPQVTQQKKSVWKFMKLGKSSKVGVLNKQNTVQRKKTEELEEFRKEQMNYFRDDGTLQLVFQVLAKLCDGQHKQLQHYLREQPDNPRSFNLVSAVTLYLQVTFHAITPECINLIIQVFTTLTELCAGNQVNRVVILDGKVIDYINFILRTDTFEGCSLSDTLKLYKSIADLLIAMTEESSPEAFRVAKDVGNTIDVYAVASTMQRCYDIQTRAWWANWIKVNKLAKTDLSVAGDLAKRVGYKYYMVFARINDVHSEISTETYNNLLKCGRALDYYRGNVLSIEINKGGHLQKIYFPVANYKNLIRHELKESLKWNIDRSSPSEKIRDFMRWSKLIMKSITYQQRIQKNILSRFIVKHIFIWHYIMILLSFVINIIMISTWYAPLSVKDLPQNATFIPSALYSYKPDVHLTYWPYIFLCIALLHNVFTFLLVFTFFIAESPTLPKPPDIKAWFSDDKTSRKELKDTTKESVTHLISIRTLYYIMLMVFSIMGSLTEGYFFAFHLFDIVTVNQLLKGVIRAVTLNGRSLIYVAILGVIFLYVYALIGFALFRPVFDPNGGNELYCATLWQCSVTLIRYGLVGIDEVVRRHPAENTFQNFGYLVMYQITFFILFTTIGLNIIFGIIVDTFSELRDLKWRAEKDMQDYCFICSLPSFELEHRGKGFYYHVNHEHNMWAYIYYCIYLGNTNINDYTALDYYVYKLLGEENYSFFPQQQALCLINYTDTQQPVEEEDPMAAMSTEIAFLVRKVNEQSQHKKAKKDKKKRDRLKRRSLRTPTIRTSHHDDNDDADHTHPSEFLPRRHGSTGPQTSNLRAHPTTSPHLPPTQWSVITPRDVQLQGSTPPPPHHDHKDETQTSLYKKGPNAQVRRSRSRSRTRDVSISSLGSGASDSQSRRHKSKSPHRVRQRSGSKSPAGGSSRTGSRRSSLVEDAGPSVTLPGATTATSDNQLSSEIRKKAHEKRAKALEKEMKQRKQEVTQADGVSMRRRPVLKRHMTEQQHFPMMQSTESSDVHLSDDGGGHRRRERQLGKIRPSRPSTP